MLWRTAIVAVTDCLTMGYCLTMGFAGIEAFDVATNRGLTRV